eukprot:SAG31_NODE_36739_length_310_cov_1.947867_1_plen_39_part_10
MRNPVALGNLVAQVLSLTLSLQDDKTTSSAKITLRTGAS